MTIPTGRLSSASSLVFESPACPPPLTEGLARALAQAILKAGSVEPDTEVSVTETSNVLAS
jgi:hypothetical protein